MYRFVYLHCDKASEKASGGLEFETRGWIPSSLVLQEIAALIQEEVQIVKYFKIHYYLRLRKYYLLCYYIL